jgi:hypothetical protein
VRGRWPRRACPVRDPCAPQYAPSVFERFTEDARQVVVLAQDEARALKHNYIGTEHILLGLFRVEGCLAAQVLESLGARLEEVRGKVVRIVGQGDAVTTGQIPFTKHARRVLELALREALSLGHNYIGDEHILLAIVRENEGVGARIMLDYDADAEKLRDAVIQALDGSVGEESKVELNLLRVVPVAQQMSDGTWVVSVEVWDHGLVVRWATSDDWPVRAPELHGWRVSDDVGTSYAQVSGSGGGSPQRGFSFHAEFAPAPPPGATSVRIRHEALDNELSVPLTD